MEMVNAQQLNDDSGSTSTRNPSDLTYDQDILLILLQVFSATLSLVGSCTIFYKISRNIYRHKWTGPYDRIMLGLSSCDILASLVYALNPFLLPSATSQIPWSFGSQASCQFMGMLAQLSLGWQIWYNCLLSYFYLLTIRFQVKRSTFVKKYELGMHLSGAIFFPVTAVIGYVFGWYGEQDLVPICWTKDVPTGCDANGENCTGDADYIVGLVYGGLPSAITLFSLIINNIVIYSYVRKSFSKTPRSSIHSTEERPAMPKRKSMNNTSIEDFLKDQNSISSSEGGEQQEEERRIALVDEDTSESTTSEELDRLSDEQRKLRQKKLTRETATQGFLYVSNYFLTVTPLTIVLVLDSFFNMDQSDKPKLYPLLVLSAILVPLQGFFNVFIYVRPTYNRFRAKNPDKPMWFVLQRALFDSRIPRTSGMRKASMEAAAKKHDEMKRKGGSNFSLCLDNIIEEDSEPPSDDEEGDENSTNSVEDLVATEESCTNSGSQPDIDEV